jgi:LacI family transcriptional regulator
MSSRPGTPPGVFPTSREVLRYGEDLMGKKLTLNDVAAAARVSPSTVSRIARGSARVSPEVRDRVLKAASTLGFSLARGNKPRVVTFLLCNRDVLHYFHSRVLAGAEAYLAERDYNLLYLSFRYPPGLPWQDIDLPKVLRRRDMVSGFIVAGTNTQNLLDLLRRTEVPFVVFGNNVLGEWREGECDTVWSDDPQGAYELTQYLQSLGHRDIWFIGNCQLAWYARTYEGYSRAMLETGLVPHLSSFDMKNEEDLGFLATKSILGQGRPVTAIFAGGDVIARGVYRALRDARLKVPESISVVGFNDIEAENLHPSLTTAHVFCEQIGSHLAELLLNRITAPDHPPRRSTIPTQVVKRESCAPVAPIREPSTSEPLQKLVVTP